MKHLHVLAAASAIVAFGTSAALADPDGFVAGNIGWIDLDSNGYQTDGLHLGGQITGAFDFTPSLGAQGDLVLTYNEPGSEDDSTNFTSLDAALHAYFRAPEGFLVGGFVQYGTTEVSGDDAISFNRGYVGVEGQAYFDQFTAYGQLGLQTLTSDDDTGGTFEDVEGWFVTGELRYFLTPDFVVNLHAGRSELDIPVDPNYSVNVPVFNVGLGTEYKLDDMPVSIFGSYDYSMSEFAFLSAQEFTSHRVLVGLKFNLGEDSLQERDRSGASLKPVDFGTIAIPPFSGGQN